jgi:hypothetical protein
MNEPSFLLTSLPVAEVVLAELTECHKACYPGNEVGYAKNPSGAEAIFVVCGCAEPPVGFSELTKEQAEATFAEWDAAAPPPQQGTDVTVR